MHNTVEIPVELLADFLQCCQWLKLVSPELDPMLLKLFQEQAALVEAWGQEYATAGVMKGEKQ